MLPDTIDMGPADASQAVLLLHGIGGRAAGWHAVQTHLAAQGWRSIAWDMPGYGRSPALAASDMAALAQALRAGTLPLTMRIGSLAAALQAAVRQCIGAPASAQPLHGTVRP